MPEHQLSGILKSSGKEGPAGASQQEYTVSQEDSRRGEPLAINPEPIGRFSLTQMLPTLVFDVALPILAFNVLTSYGVPTLWALIVGGLFPASNNLHVWVKSRKLEPLGMIVMTFLAIGTVASLISGSVFVALIIESILT